LKYNLAIFLKFTDRNNDIYGDDMLKTDEFFDQAAGFYDEMIQFATALERRREQLVTILPAEQRNVADLGCGSGLDSIAAALAGHTVTCFDLSQNMLEQAKHNGEENGVRLKTIQSDIKHINASFHNTFDLVISTGNVLALMEKDSVGAVMRKIYSLLTHGGSAVVQLLNFDKILKTKERILAITKHGERHYIRFYDFHNTHVNFNILRFNGALPPERELITTKLYPHLREELIKKAESAGFKSHKVFGGLQLQEYKPEASNDICLVLKKN
jgi:glycine/sarcosine N-methyltransferase